MIKVVKLKYYKGKKMIAPFNWITDNAKNEKELKMLGYKFSIIKEFKDKKSANKYLIKENTKLFNSTIPKRFL